MHNLVAQAQNSVCEKRDEPYPEVISMRSTETSAMEILVNIPPVRTIVEARAFETAGRLSLNGLWNKNFTSGHGGN